MELDAPGRLDCRDRDAVDLDHRLGCQVKRFPTL